MSELQDRLQNALGDAYRIEREITGGGMSRLFLATEASLNRQVVIKLLAPELASEVSAARFQREIHVAAQLQHPHILPVLTSGARDGLAYYIMPYVAGESLRHRLARAGRLPVSEAIGILREIADALAYAHRRGVIHRDIKPANILLEEDHAVLTDFGIARAIEAAQAGDAKERLTFTGMSLGTMGYMAPEQLVGERDVDARADVYSLALVGYEMLTGTLPFAESTGQALFAAHLTESPKPVSTLRGEVPAPLNDAIGKALAKDPADRFQTAGQFRAALDLPATTSFPVVPRRSIVVRWLAVAGVVLAVIGGAAMLVVRSHVRSTLDPNLIAIAPFDLRDVSDTTWRQGLVDYLSRKLDGAGRIRTVPPTRSIRLWPGGRADRATAEELGRRTGASLVVWGTLVGEGEDSVTISASILDIAGQRILGGSEIERRGHRNRINSLADSLALSLLRELGKTRPIASFRQTSLGAGSLPALKAFLQGEQFYRQSVWDSALAYYQRAVSQDSTFALAHRRAGLMISWQRGAADSLSRAYMLHAGRFTRGLSPRDSLLLIADSVRAGLSAFETDTAYLLGVRRLFSTLEQAKRFYPDDPEVWFAVGDAYFHFGLGPSVSVTPREVFDAFDRSIALDSSFAPAYIHQVELGFSLGGLDVGRRYARAYLALDPTEAHIEGHGIRLVEAVADAREAWSRGTSRIVDTSSVDALFRAWLAIRRWPDSAETAIRLARLPAAGRRSSGAWFADPSRRRVLLAQQLGYRGHVREAYRTLERPMRPGVARLFAELILLGGVPPDSARAVLGAWLRDGTVYPATALPWWAAQGDTAAILAMSRRADSLARAASTPVERRDARYRGAALDAYLALARRDTVAALRLFESLPDTLCFLCYIDRLTKAQLLASRGRHRDAERLLDERLYILLSPSEVLFALERGRVAERLSKKDKAIDAYALVVGAWAHADSALQPEVAEARRALERLGSDRAVSASVSRRRPEDTPIYAYVSAAARRAPLLR